MAKIKNSRWKIPRLIQEAKKWLQRTKKKKSPVSEQSSWWDFLWRFPDKQASWVKELVNGSYLFSPMRTYQIGTENIVMWEYCDRMMLSLFWAIIKPLFKHIISKLFFHLKGSAGVKGASEQLRKPMESKNFRYVIRHLSGEEYERNNIIIK